MACVYGSVMLVSTAQTQAAVDYMWVCVWDEQTYLCSCLQERNGTFMINSDKPHK